ncbi:MAG TPA: glycosyltransferase, partial [Candidatus Acidoferrales bacterium]|nr:glycosyltransferase [Candidatus Acidoferrales bacterium]
DQVRIVTGIPHERVPEYLNAMDLMCAPSETAPNWREVFGRMIVEAFACGVAVVASDSGEMPRVVADAGRIVHERSPIELSDAIRDLLDRPALRSEYAARGLERVRTTYTWPIVARRHLDFFEELLSGRAR